MDKLSAVFTNQSTGDILHSCFVNESQLAMACCYAKQLSNQYKTGVDLTLYRKPMTYSFVPENVSKTPPKSSHIRKTDDSPSVLPFLGAGD